MPASGTGDARTRELFLQKIHEFQLIIFDRYARQGVLPIGYFENIARLKRLTPSGKPKRKLAARPGVEVDKFGERSG